MPTAVIARTAVSVNISEMFSSVKKFPPLLISINTESAIITIIKLISRIFDEKNFFNFIIKLHLLHIHCGLKNLFLSNACCICKNLRYSALFHNKDCICHTQYFRQFRRNHYHSETLCRQF